MERINGLVDIADKCTGYIGRKRINVLVIYSTGRRNGAAILGQRPQMDLERINGLVVLEQRR